MIEFGDWHNTLGNDSIYTKGTWNALVCYPSGRWKFEFFAKVAAVSSMEILVNSDENALLDLFMMRITDAIADAAVLIERMTASKIIVKRDRRGRQKGRLLNRILWMTNKEALQLIRMGNGDLFSKGRAA